jgi:hypothetical protein
MQKTYPRSLDLEAVASQLENHFHAQDFEVSKSGNANEMIVQLRKAGLAREATGLDRALTVHMVKSSTSTSVTLGQAAWGTKIGVFAVGWLFLWPLAISSIYGTWMQQSLPQEIWKVIDTYASGQGFSSSKQTVFEPMSCPNCGVMNIAGARFCNSCGSSLKESPTPTVPATA